MDPILQQVITQVPMLALLVFLFYMFRGYHKEREAFAQAGLAGGDNGRMAEAITALSAAFDSGMTSMKENMDRMAAETHEAVSAFEQVSEQVQKQRAAVREIGSVLSEQSDRVSADFEVLEQRLHKLEQAPRTNGHAIENDRHQEKAQNGETSLRDLLKID